MVAARIRRRRGFTLVELLMVIIVIALLVALLLPAIMGAVRKGNEARVLSEISAMSQALAAFKEKYGDYPPSRIILAENGDYSTSNTGIGAAGQALAARSVSYLRKFWPRLQLSTAGPTGVYYDFTGRNLGTSTATNPAYTVAYTISGDECLVFFLGGVPQQTSSSVGGTTFSMTGWSKNPLNPFVSASVTSNRQPPFYEFPSSRLTDIDGEGMPEFKDPIDSDPKAGQYVYFSAYGGVGYDPDDVNYAGPQYPREAEAASNLSQTDLRGGFMVSNLVTSSGNDSARPDWISSQSPNPYTASDPLPTGGASPGSYDHSKAVLDVRPPSFVNPQSFQLFSPGYDRYYGIGGQYLQNGTGTRVPFNLAQSGANADVTPETLTNDARLIERDNLANFATSRLDP